MSDPYYRNLTVAARRAAGLDPAPGCRHLNVRLIGTNNIGTPFDCLDCGASELPWTALNGLLTELNEVITRAREERGK